MTTTHLLRAIATQQQTITQMDNDATKLEARAEGQIGTDRAITITAAQMLRGKLRSAICDLHTLQARLPAEEARPADPAEWCGQFAHETDDAVNTNGLFDKLIERLAA